MKNFFPLPASDIVFMASLMSLAVFAFLPWSREVHWHGMAVQGWMMGLLMVLSPMMALVRLRMTHRRSRPSRETRA